MAGPNRDAWDKIVREIPVPSRCNLLEQSGLEYKLVFDTLTKIHGGLTELARKAAENWTGQGGQAFQAHINALARSLDQNMRLHVAVVDGLGRLGTHVRTAVRNITVPADLVGEVRANPAYTSSGWIYSSTYVRVAPTYLENTTDVDKEKRDRYFLVGAQAARQVLVTEYGREANLLPRGEPLTPPRVNVPGGGPGTGPGTRRPGAGPGTGPGAGGLGLPSSQLQPTSFGGATPNTQVPSVQTPEQPVFTPPKVDIPKTPDVEIPETPDFGLAGVPGGGGGFGGGGGGGLPVAEAPAATTAGFGGGGGGARGVTVPGAGGGVANTGTGMYPPMYPPHGGGGQGQGQAGGRNDDLVREHEVRVVFGFETDQSDEPEIPKSGVLSA